LNLIFAKHNFQAEFLPTMYYMGSGFRRVKESGELIPTWMLTFTILGSRITDASKQPYRQDINQYLSCKFLFANDTKLSCYQEKSFQEENFDADPVTLITESYTVKNLWV